MKLIVFTKLFKEKSIQELVSLANETGLDGFDLCLRKGYAVSPENARTQLKEMVRVLEKEDLSIPMATGEGHLLLPDAPEVEPLLAALDSANVRLLNLGYFRFNPHTMDYWKEVDRIRSAFEGWQMLSRRYHVKICYHTHSHLCMGVNCAALMHLLRGFDPACIGAYIDPGHMAVEGEDFSFGTSMVREYLSIVAVKDVLRTRREWHTHGASRVKFVPAGQGMLDWTAIFAELRRINFQGPISVHCEFHVPQEEFERQAMQEVRFFRERCKESIIATLPPEPWSG
jgi:sugar phosphate isomerase/epimerase